MPTSRLRMALLLLVAVAIIPLTGCQANAGMDLEAMPDYVQDAPDRVQEAYHYAMTHPDEVAKYPCYCGCGNMGHKSNLDCYVDEIQDDGTVIFDDHAAGCGLCVDITQDVIRLKDKGWSSPDIRAYVDAQYSSFGPGTDTPLPTE